MIRVLALIVAFAIPPAIYFPTLGAHRAERLHAAREQLAQLDIARTASATPVVDRSGERLPPAPAIDEIHALTESVASDNALQLTRFEPGLATADNALQSQSVKAEVVGTAEATAAFLRKMETASKIVDVSHVTLTKDPAGWRTAFVITTYAMR